MNIFASGMRMIQDAVANATAQAQQQHHGGFAAPGPYDTRLKVYPLAMANKQQYEVGDKVVLPASSLHWLAQLRVVYPMLFKLENPASGRATHCGVIEFSAEEGVAYLPYWMMQNLLIQTGSIINIKNVNLERGKFVKLQPHSMSFTELSNPRVILETTLRNYSCLTKGDTIMISAGGIDYYMDVVEVRPGDAISVIETDVDVDFAPPKDMAQHEAEQARKAEEKARSDQDAQFEFAGVTPDTDAAASASQSATPDGGVASDYFSKLGRGYSLKDRKPKKSKKSKKGVGDSPSVASPMAAPVQSIDLTSAEVAPLSATRPQRVTEDVGRWKYIYEVDPKTQAKRLIRRVPLASAGPAASNSTGGSSSGFKPFAGKGYSLQ